MMNVYAHLYKTDRETLNIFARHCKVRKIKFENKCNLVKRHTVVLMHGI